MILLVTGHILPEPKAQTEPIRAKTGLPSEVYELLDRLDAFQELLLLLPFLIDYERTFATVSGKRGVTGKDTFNVTTFYNKVTPTQSSKQET